MTLYKIFIFWLFLASTALAGEWREVAPGLSYRDMGLSLLTPWSHIHVFRIDLKQHQLGLITAHDLEKTQASISDFAQHSNALLTINGGFFDQHFHPLGLRIHHAQQRSALKRVSWWGIFYIKNNTPHVSSPLQFKLDPDIDFAVQSGPRLLINGEIPKLRPGRDERTALGITHDGQVIVLVTENFAMTTTAVAELLNSPALQCENALNLDGGSSSQLYANFTDFQLHVHGFSNVSDAIVIL